MNRVLKCLIVSAVVCLTSALAHANYNFYFTANTGVQSDAQFVDDIGDYVSEGPYAPATSVSIVWPYMLEVVVNTDNVAPGSYWVGTVMNYNTMVLVYVHIQ